jgi:hypothetical protein
MGQRLHGCGNSNGDLFVHLLQQHIIADLRSTLNRPWVPDVKGKERERQQHHGGDGPS